MTGLLDDLLQDLLGCVWGRFISTEDDSDVCGERAEQIVVLHDGDRECALKLCAKHRDRVFAETTPHEDTA